VAFIYFLQARNGRSLIIKIGRTGQCPYKRLRELRKSHPSFDQMEMLACIPTAQPVQAEREHHKKFSALRSPRNPKDRDWFRPGPDLCEYIQDWGQPHVCHPDCHRLSPRHVQRLEQIAQYEKKLRRQLDRKLTTYKKNLK